MYYSSGNYEAFARPKKPEGIENKSAWIVGSGLAGLSAACYLVRDAQMPGDHIHIFEKDPISGGACDGWDYPTIGYVMRGGREMDNHFEVMWDLLRSIPSIETEDVSVLDEYYWLNKEDPNFSLCRVTEKQGKNARTHDEFQLSDKAAKELMHLFFTPEKELEDKTIEDVLSPDVLNSNFWLYWRTMFAFENWHSALEMKRYMQRFVHHIGGLPNLEALRFTRYNQYESMILPMEKYLKDHGVIFEYDTRVIDIKFDIQPDGKKATEIQIVQEGREKNIPLSDNDYVFITNGGNVENSTYGSQDTPAELDFEIREGSGWDLWRRIARVDPAFGNPEAFCSDPEKTNWMSATVTLTDDKIAPYIKEICQRDLRTGHTVTGGIVTARDSSWLLSWTINRQPQFRKQKDNEVVVWVYGLFSDRNGDYIKKPMRQCTGREICEEWLYQIGVPTDKIEKLASTSAITVPVMMPYVTSFFMPRKESDRPRVVPEGAKNFAFIGQFAETPRDTIFTTEYSMRTGMEAVYTLLDVDRGVPEVWGSVYDIRDLINAGVAMRDGRKLTDMPMNLEEKIALHKAARLLRNTDIEQLLKSLQAI